MGDAIIGQHNDTWQILNDTLRVMVSLKAGQKEQPSGESADSKLVKTVAGGEEISFDGGKKVKGHKRTIWVDRMGLLLAVCVHGVGHSDHVGMILLAPLTLIFGLA